MKSALLNKSLPQPIYWQDLPLGEELKLHIENALAEISCKFFGYHMVKLGNLSSQLNLAHCPIKHDVRVTNSAQSFTSLVAESTDLPLAENSIDTFVLAQELDFAKDPHQILREVDRAIVANGYVVISGFNPLSLCGLFKYLPVNSGSPLHQGRFFSCVRVKDWLNLLGFEVIETQHLLFNELFLQRPLFKESKWTQWCNQHLPLLSTMYVIVARKREIPLTLIKPKLKTKRKFSAVGASVRSVNASMDDNPSSSR